MSQNLQKLAFFNEHVLYIDSRCVIEVRLGSFMSLSIYYNILVKIILLLRKFGNILSKCIFFSPPFPQNNISNDVIKFAKLPINDFINLGSKL